MFPWTRLTFALASFAIFLYDQIIFGQGMLDMFQEVYVI